MNTTKPFFLQIDSKKKKWFLRLLALQVCVHGINIFFSSNVHSLAFMRQLRVIISIISNWKKWFSTHTHIMNRNWPWQAIFRTHTWSCCTVKRKILNVEFNFNFLDYYELFFDDHHHHSVAQRKETFLLLLFCIILYSTKSFYSHSQHQQKKHLKIHIIQKCVWRTSGRVN